MILIADDNMGIRKMIRNLVEDLDSEVLECVSGQEAIEMYEEYKPDLVLMDVNMSPVDGLTATRRILERFPDARIVIVTQHHDRSTREASLAVGAYAFIGKDDVTQVRELVSERLQLEGVATGHKRDTEK